MPSQDPSRLGAETRALHAGWRADPTTGSVAVPIHQTTAYRFRDTDHAESLFALKELGNLDTRITNPTVSTTSGGSGQSAGGAGSLARAA